jgi:Tol biopolymer transport system component
MGSIWSADGKELIHGSSLGGREGVYSLPASGGGTERLLLKDGGEYAVIPEAMVPSTGRMVVGQSGGLGGWSLVTFAPGENAARPLLVNPSIEGGAALSPDGKWMAYASDSSGQYEVYVRPFPEAGGKWQISRDGGKGAAWSRDGREIFYTHGDRMMAVPVDITGGFAPGDPRELFRFEFTRRSTPVRDYDVSPDGKRFIMRRRLAGESAPRQIDILTNFAASIGR